MKYGIPKGHPNYNITKGLYLRHGITLEEKTKLLEEQNNKCAICETTDFGKSSPHVDHCHTTQTIRGVLCNSCNRGLGLFKDNINSLAKAIIYLERYRE